MSLLRRSAKVSDSSPPPLPDGVPTCVFRLPALLEMITLGKWDDGAPRVRGSLSLFWEDGVFKLWINDKDGGRAASVSAASVEDLLLRAEGKLSEDSLDWRRAFSSGRNGKK